MSEETFSLDVFSSANPKLAKLLTSKAKSKFKGSDLKALNSIPFPMPYISSLDQLGRLVISTSKKIVTFTDLEL